VLLRAEVFFEEINRHGQVTSPQLISLLSLKGARSIPANLTNPLKKRVRKFGFARPPWEEDATTDNRTRWGDRDGISAGMLQAIRDERKARKL